MYIALTTNSIIIFINNNKKMQPNPISYTLSLLTQSNTDKKGNLKNIIVRRKNIKSQLH